jgi:hypothetical protein
MRRKGLGVGRGKGYRNLIPNYDSRIHSESAKGIKRPQRFRIFVRPEGENKSKPLNIFFKDRKKAETWAGIETAAGMGEVYNVRGGKFRPSLIQSLDATINKYERLKDKSNLSPAEKRSLAKIESKLERVKPSKQLMNYAKKHKAVLVTAAVGTALSLGSMLGMKHTDPLSAGTLMAFPIGYLTYEGRLHNQLRKAEYDKITTKFPHIPESKRNEIAFRLVQKKIYGGKAAQQDYILIHNNGRYYKVVA